MKPLAFEDQVRNLAALKWSRQCNKETIIGIEIDGVLQIDENHFILLQITQNERLDKFRKDILDLDLVRRDLFDKKYIYADSYLITEEEVSSRMIETVHEKKMKTMTFRAFKNEFLDYESYKHLRGRSPFGSAVIPETGEKENNIFVKVKYYRNDNKSEVSYEDIIKYLLSGKKIILKGEYGTGKSRLLQSIFEELNNSGISEYTIAVDLRDYKGVETDDELIRRHFRKYGLSQYEDSSVKCLNNGQFIFLIDGFDEVSVQSWSENPQKIVDIRYKEFGFIRQIIKSTKKGFIITGREHFFNDDGEMIKAFGLSNNDYIIIESKNEFTEDEISRFKKENEIEINIPKWFPKKPMAVRLLSENLLSDDIKLALKLDNPYYFWMSFFEYIADRDSDANKNVLDPDAIKQLLSAIAAHTRNTSQNTGPVTIEDLNRIFRTEFGYEAIEESSAYLQRLPGMGRVESDSYDRKFTDDYFLDFLRVYNYKKEIESGFSISCDLLWKNILSRQGLELLSGLLIDKNTILSLILQKLKNKKNVVMAIELISSYLLGNSSSDIDFNQFALNGAECSFISFAGKRISNLKITNSFLYSVDITNSKFYDTSIKDSFITKIYGVSSRNGIEKIIDESTDIDEYEQISSIAKIKQVKLSSSQQYLVLIIQKVFNQKGAGKKEEVLTRGFNGIYDKKLAAKILNLLERESILSTHLGDEGKIYKGNKKFQPRAEKILEDLSLSNDEIWKKVSELT